jgi:hypothetical protein
LDCGQANKEAFALFGWLEKRLMLMLMLICCERKTLLFRLKGTTDKFKRTGRLVLGWC